MNTKEKITAEQFLNNCSRNSGFINYHDLLHSLVTLKIGKKDFDIIIQESMQEYAKRSYLQKLEEAGSELPTGDEINFIACEDKQQDWNDLRFVQVHEEAFIGGANWMKQEASILLAKKDDLFSRMQNHLLEIQNERDKTIERTATRLMEMAQELESKDKELKEAMEDIIRFPEWIDGCMYSRMAEENIYLEWTDGNEIVANTTGELYAKYKSSKKN